MSRIALSFAALTLVASPVLAQEQAEPTQVVDCTENLDKLPEDYREQCETALSESAAAGSNAGTVTVIVPVAVLASVGIAVAASDDDRPLSN